jgi:hypothetical protein
MSRLAGRAAWTVAVLFVAPAALAGAESTPEETATAQFACIVRGSQSGQLLPLETDIHTFTLAEVRTIQFDFRQTWPSLVQPLLAQWVRMAVHMPTGHTFFLESDSRMVLTLTSAPPGTYTVELQGRHLSAQTGVTGLAALPYQLQYLEC